MKKAQVTPPHANADPHEKTFTWQNGARHDVGDMARLTSCWDGSVALMLLILPLLAATIDRTVVAGKVIFPDAESCTLNNGETGHCVPLLDCPSVLQTFKERPPVQCGFEGFTQIVCCPKGQDTTTESSQNIVDISPPSDYYTLDCGISATKIIETFGPGFGPSVSRASRSIRPSIKEVPKAVEATPPVVGGRISKRAAWPWMALVGQRDADGIDWFCGGALINEHWVLSALHCFHDFKADVVRLGEYNYENDNDGADHKDFGVAELVLYPDYKYPQAYHDLALLRLDRKVTLQKFILPVCLPWGNKSEESIVDNVATIVGWGNTLFGGFPSSVLMEAKLQVFPSPRCNSTYSTLPYYSNTWPHGIGEETLCAGDPDGGKDACQGDSGGPLITRDTRGHYVAAGIVSRGYGCGLKDYPGLYANLRNPPYLAWIKKVAFGLK